MVRKSIIIIGKGPSINRCNKDFVDSFDEVAICNRPIFEGYEHLISARAHYDFITNDVCIRNYPESLKNKLGIKETIFTGDDSILRNNFSYKDLNPSTGTLAFHYFTQLKEYTHIALVGFDLFQLNKKVYYFKREEVIQPLAYLFENDDVYSKDMKIIKEHGHDSKLTHDYMSDIFEKNKDTKFTLITDYPFESMKNVDVR